MKTTGVIDIGDMGSGLALNLIKHGFQVTGHDLLEKRMEAFHEMGGLLARNSAEVGAVADAVFVMVMTGDEAKDVILGVNGLLSSMQSGGAILLSATIKPREAREIGAAMEGSGIHLIDTPVSGGFPGAQGGTLTMMASAPDTVLDEFEPVMEAVSQHIHRVGTTPGMGQTVKACLQSLIGAQFSATFEAAALAAKPGVPGQVILDVFSTSSAGCGVVNNALEKLSIGSLKVPAAISTRCTRISPSPWGWGRSWVYLCSRQLRRCRFSTWVKPDTPMVTIGSAPESLRKLWGQSCIGMVQHEAGCHL